jgi:hypothetical protein
MLPLLLDEGCRQPSRKRFAPCKSTLWQLATSKHPRSRALTRRTLPGAESTGAFWSRTIGGKRTASSLTCSDSIMCTLSLSTTTFEPRRPIISCERSSRRTRNRGCRDPSCSDFSQTKAERTTRAIASLTFRKPPAPPDSVLRDYRRADRARGSCRCFIVAIGALLARCPLSAGNRAAASAAVAMRTSGRGPVSKRKQASAGQLDSLAGLAGLAGLERRSRRRGEGAPS